MALIIQDDTGTVAGANSYNTIAEFKAYHDARGGDYSGSTDDQINAAIIRATDYVDARFYYVGFKQNSRAQTTQWPRINAFDCANYAVSGVPDEIKAAVNEYAFRALSTTLNPDQTQDGTGRAYNSKSETVGPISVSTAYESGSGATMPRYPAADQKIIKACLVCQGSTLVRA